MDVHFCISTLQIAAGPYSLVAGVVFNGAAIASSAAVNITVTNLAPVLYNIRLTSGAQQLAVSGAGQPGYNYILMSTTNLAVPMSWVPVVTNAADISGNISFPNVPIANTQEFYRIAEN